MRTALVLEKDYLPGADSSPVTDAMRALLRLVHCQESGTDPSATANGSCSEEILVDTELDGVRYLIIRMPRPATNRVQLSPREHEIVRMVAQGHPNKVIADVLNISSWTVCTHLRRIFAKLGVSSRAAMVAQLLELGAIAKEHRPAYQR